MKIVALNRAYEILQPQPVPTPLASLHVCSPCLTGFQASWLSFGSSSPIPHTQAACMLFPLLQVSVQGSLRPGVTLVDPLGRGSFLKCILSYNYIPFFHVLQCI